MITRRLSTKLQYHTCSISATALLEPSQVGEATLARLTASELSPDKAVYLLPEANNCKNISPFPILTIRVN